ncbi:MAG TPA: ferritin-like domain-containing protein [Streptomyces sp.]|nr:ferritin-like domain-containing protein [Streptomyces sp.]
MLWARDLVQEVLDNDASFRLLCSLAAAAEGRNGRENGRIAALVPEGQRELAPGLARHGAQGRRHARLLAALPKLRGLEPVEVPPETDHALLLESRANCPAHARLRRGEPLKEWDVIAHLAHGYVAETRAAAWFAPLAARFAGHPEIGRAVREVFRAKRDHLAYCRQGLLRFCRAGHGAAVQRLLREHALAEVRVHRDVSLAVLARTGHLLGWPVTRSVVLEARVQTVYAYGRLLGWRRTVRLAAPARTAPPASGAVPGTRGGPSGRTATASRGV